MESEILNAMKEDMYFSMLIEVIVLITVLLTSAGIPWLCFEEMQRLSPPACRRLEKLRRRERPTGEARQVNRTLEIEHFVDPHSN